jgi:hypothetical protein
LPFVRAPQIHRPSSRALRVPDTSELAVLLANPGLVAFTALALALIGYLAYSMMRPELF